MLAGAGINILLYLEIQKGKVKMTKDKYASTHKATAANVMRMSEHTKRSTNATAEGEPSTVPAQTYLGDSWFTLIEAATELALRGDHYIGVLKTNHAGFPRELSGEYYERLACWKPSCYGDRNCEQYLFAC